MNINEYLELTRDEYKDDEYSFLKVRPWIVCNDGFNVSIQASSSHYCSPRDDYGPYYTVEAGYASEEVPEWDDYYDGDIIYGNVPVELIEVVLYQHGGIANGVYTWAEDR